VSTGTAPLYQSRGALEETLQTRSASLRIYVKEIVTRVDRWAVGAQEPTRHRKKLDNVRRPIYTFKYKLCKL